MNQSALKRVESHTPLWSTPLPNAVFAILNTALD